MSLSKKQKRQLGINISLMALALLSLVVCVVAWLSYNKSAKISELNLVIEREHLELKSEITQIDFPCATKINDTTQNLFNTECAVAKTYVISGEGQLYVAVDCFGPGGMLAYVCEDADETDYYGAMKEELATLGNVDIEADDLTFSELSAALKKVNDGRLYGNTNSDGDTEITIVYWLEYDQIDEFLTGETYWDSDQQDTKYHATVTFAGA